MRDSRNAWNLFEAQARYAHNHGVEKRRVINWTSQRQDHLSFVARHGRQWKAIVMRLHRRAGSQRPGISQCEDGVQAIAAVQLRSLGVERRVEKVLEEALALLCV